MRRGLILGIGLFVLLLAGLFFIPEVSAENTVCCEETTGGEFCQYAPESQCKQGPGLSAAPTSCDNTAYCNPGCCIDSSGEGYCYAGYPRAMCENKFGIGAKFDSDASCDSVPECGQGCCIIGSQASYVTENRCKKETEHFGDLAMDFRQASSEAECLAISRTADLGCCVTPEGSCTYTSDAECDIAETIISIAENETLVSGFYRDQYCSEVGSCACAPSDPALKSNLETDTVRTGCLDGSDDVYYFDSCGNPEGVAEACDYTNGDLCGDADGDGDYVCEPTDCNGNADISRFRNFPDYKDASDGGFLNGESWCLYDYDLNEIKGGNTLENDVNTVHDNLRNLGFASREPVGSRHYRAICINGKQFVEPGEDFRKEWCLQGYVDGSQVNFLGDKDYTEARLIENRWQSCIDECNTAAPDMSKEDYEAAQEDDLECCTDVSQRDCGWVGGKCTPRVAPGTKFWEGEGSNNCGKASMACSFAVQCDGWASIFGACGYIDKSDSGKTAGDIFGTIIPFVGMEGWRPVNPSEANMCTGQDFVQASNNLCRSHGDCGASYNLIGEHTFGGFDSPEDLGSSFENIDNDNMEDNILSAENLPSWEEGFEILDYRLDDNAIPTAEKVDAIQWVSMSTSLATIAVPAVLAGLEVWPAAFGSTMWSAPVKIFGATAGAINSKAAAKAASEAYRSTYNSLVAGSGDKAAKEAATKASEEAAAKAGGAANPVVAALSVYMWIKLAYDVVDVLAADTDVITVQTTCSPWEAPKNTATCEQCNPEYYMKNGKATSPDAFKKCSEYRCKSFGSTCELLNSGTDNETCVSLSQYDVNSPLIDPWAEGLDANYSSFQETVYGYELTKEVPIYERVTLAFETDEPAQCKMSFNHSNRYDDMDPIYFGSTLYEYYHAQTIFYPASKKYTEGGLELASGGEYTVYVRCSDGVGNANEKDYAITFTVGDEPDLTPPVIEGTSIGDEAYLTAGADETQLSVYLNEPGYCRYSMTPLDYADVPVTKQCITKHSPNMLGLYECDYKGNDKITGLGGTVTDIKHLYIKCRDKHDNTNKEPYQVSLFGSEVLNITSVQPTGDLYLDLDIENVTLEVRTEGGAQGNGEATCKYTTQESKKNYYSGMDDFMDSFSGRHEKVLTGLSTGGHVFYVGCQDKAGNVVYNQTSFSVLVDNVEASINKYYWSEESGINHLTFITSELAECQYSSVDFEYGAGSMTLLDGTVHDTAEDLAVYYVKCKDMFDNVNEQAYRFTKI
jgi:hypothetical protein